MTRDEILAMEAGRELDALVAEKVMGFAKVVRDYDKRHNTEGLRSFVYDTAFAWFGKETPRYSTDIAAAWLVVEHMGPIPFSLRFQPADAWRAGGGEVYCYAHWTCWFEGGKEIDADTAALAICRAALLAVMEAD